MKSHGVYKDRRKRLMLELLERWGRLDIDQIVEHLGAKVEINSHTIRRTLYRDLNELVEEGLITDIRYSRDGTLLEEFDPNIHKNATCEWALRGSENTLTGQAILHEAGGHIGASSRLRSGVLLAEGVGTVLESKLNCFFSFGTKFLCLRCDLEVLPMHILVSRKNPSQPDEEHHRMEEHFGKRLIVLNIPVPSLSSIKSGKKSGHVLITLEGPNRAQVTDLGSTNGTQVAEVKLATVRTIIKTGQLLGTKTLKDPMLIMEGLMTEWTNIQAFTPTEALLPSLVRLSDAFGMMLVGSKE